MLKDPALHSAGWVWTACCRDGPHYSQLGTPRL